MARSSFATVSVIAPVRVPRNARAASFRASLSWDDKDPVDVSGSSAEQSWGSQFSDCGEHIDRN